MKVIILFITIIVITCNIICINFTSCDFDGRNRRVVVEGHLPHPFALTQYKNLLYWTDWETHCIHACDKLTGTNLHVIQEKIYLPMDIHAYMPSRQPKGMTMEHSHFDIFLVY